MATDWSKLPRPCAWVLSGGSSLGAVQVGMARALAEVDMPCDLVVGVSAGALNGALLADSGRSLELAAESLRHIWASLSKERVFPGKYATNATRILQGKSLYSNVGMKSLIPGDLRNRRLEEYRPRRFAVVATDVLTGHPRAFTKGPLVPAVLASAALPAILPMVTIEGREYWDGGVSTNVPVRVAELLGAKSLVVLDAGDLCHLDAPPKKIVDRMLAAFGVAVRQRVIIETPIVAQRVPMLYLPRECVPARDPLGFADATELMVKAYDLSKPFLATAPIPTSGKMTGEVHHHEVSPLDADIDADELLP